MLFRLYHSAMTYQLDRERLTKQYELHLPLLTALEQEALHEVGTALRKERLKFHSLTSRIKTFDSVAAKAEGKSIDEPIKNLVDLVGLRIVALFLGDVDRIAALLKEAFEVQFVDNKIEDGDLSKFGYLSVHLHVKFKNSFSGTRYDEIKQLVFEIQIRTIAMDAWASASHYLDYKSEEDIPTDLKRDFHALSGLFYVADKHFEMFFRNRQAAVRDVRKHSERSDFLEQEINLDTLTEYLAKKYAARPVATLSQISVLVKSLRERGLVRLGELDLVLDQNASILAKREKDKSGHFNRVGAVRVTFSDDPKFEPEAKSKLKPVVPPSAPSLR
jgi:putative GTP pyrophosphokinase